MNATSSIDVLSRPVIVGIGEDNRSDHAVRVALDLARRFDTEVELVHAFSPRGGGSDAEAAWAAAGATVEAATESLAEQLDSLPRAPDEQRPSDRLRVEKGKPFKVLVDAARRKDAGLILLGAHRRRGFIDFGNTTRALLSHAPCAVWNQVEAPRPIDRILVPVDLSDDSRAALACARGLARRFGADVTALHCFESPDFAYSRKPDADLPTYVVDDERERARLAFEAFLAANPDPDVPVAARFVEGEAGRSVLAQQNGTDLVVMATHGHGALSTVVLGGVTNAVLREAHVPVIAVRHPERVGTS